MFARGHRTLPSASWLLYRRLLFEIAGLAIGTGKLQNS